MITEKEMREALSNAYPWPKWQARVKTMTSAQVYATYTRLKNNKKI